MLLNKYSIQFALDSESSNQRRTYIVYYILQVLQRRMPMLYSIVRSVVHFL